MGLGSAEEGINLFKWLEKAGSLAKVLGSKGVPEFFNLYKKELSGVKTVEELEGVISKAKNAGQLSEETASLLKNAETANIIIKSSKLVGGMNEAMSGYIKYLKAGGDKTKNIAEWAKNEGKYSDDILKAFE